MHNFSDVILRSLDIAQIEAQASKHTQLDAIHLLIGLLKNPKSVSSKALKEIEGQIKDELKNLPQASQKLEISELKMGPKLQAWITHASSYAIQNNREQIEEKDFLRYLPQIFPQLNIDFEKLGEGQNNSEEEVPSFLTDLNDLAKQGKLDPVIGRDREIRSVMEILGRRGKNNPVLVGPAGVGKTAIIEGLAKAIEDGKTPDLLMGKTIYALDMGALMAGTKFRGEFEERLQSMLKFIKEQNGEAILFIDEIHQLVGAGKTDGAMDAANLLKPALARGELHCIGATTEDEYLKYILGDSALERRFRSVPVKEPSPEDAIEILMGIREKFEIHHGIKISEDAIYQAVMLSEQYLADKNLPDKAIDLIDEASSAMKLSAKAMPAKLVEMESEIRNKMILSQVEKENDEIKKEIEQLKSNFEQEKSKWEEEVLTVKKVSELKNQLDRLKFDLEQAERTQNYEQASKLKYSLIPEVQKQLEEQQHDWILGKKEVAQVIARQTGIPVEKILKSKQDNILQLEEVLKNRVYGQDGAIKQISDVLLTSYAGLGDETRPLGSFLLTGPSGVGKTETAKGLANFLFNSEKNLLRFDMSEYSEKHSVAKLIGAPAGYIGYDDGGVLTEAVRRNPYSVILFDEIEKAHFDFADILLQILDDGRLTDNKGRTISFKNTIVILTSNAKDIKTQFKPEVIGRLDGVLEYQGLDSEITQKLIDRQVTLLNERLKSKKVEVQLGDELVKILAQRGVSEDYGARPLQSVFQKLATRPLSKKLLSGKLEPGVYRLEWAGNLVQIDPV